MADNNTFEYKIKTSAELGAMQQTIGQQSRLIDTLKAAGKETGELEAEQKQLNQAFGEKYLELYKQHLIDLIAEQKAAGNSTGELVTKYKALENIKAPGGLTRIGEALHEALNEIPGVGALTTAMNGTLGPVAAVAAAFEGAKKSVEDFAESQAAVTSLDAALAATGQLTDEYRTKLQALAREQSEATGRTNDEWLGVIATLTKFGASTDNINEVSEATKNLAGFLGGDLQQAAMLMGKAMTGHYQMLQRYGIETDKAKSKSENLEAIFQQLASRGGGQLEARAKTLSGQWAQLTNATHEFFVGIGNLISRTGVLQAALEVLTTVLRGIDALLPSTIDKVDGLGNKFVTLDERARRAAHGMGDAGDKADGMGEDMADAEGSTDGLGKKLDASADAAGKMGTNVDGASAAVDKLRIAEIEYQKVMGLITTAEADRKKADIEHDAKVRDANDKAAAARAAASAAGEDVAKAGDKASKADADVQHKQTDIDYVVDQLRKGGIAVGDDQVGSNATGDLSDAKKHAEEQINQMLSQMGNSPSGEERKQLLQQINQMRQVLPQLDVLSQFLKERSEAKIGSQNAHADLNKAQSAADPKLTKANSDINAADTEKQTADIEYKTKLAEADKKEADEKKKLQKEKNDFVEKIQREREEAAKQELEEFLKNPHITAAQSAQAKSELAELARREIVRKYRDNPEAASRALAAEGEKQKNEQQKERDEAAKKTGRENEGELDRAHAISHEIAAQGNGALQALAKQAELSQNLEEVRGVMTKMLAILEGQAQGGGKKSEWAREIENKIAELERLAHNNQQ